LDPNPVGSITGECPYCASLQVMLKHKVLAGWVGKMLLLPSEELLVCSRCTGVARNESMLDRAISGLFLLPFLLMAAGGAGTGLYILGAMAVARDFSAAFTGIAVLLMVGGGFAGYKAGRTVRRLLTPRKMLPMSGMGTDL